MTRRGHWFAVLVLMILPGCGHKAGGVDLWDAVERDDAAAVRAFRAAGGDVNIRSWVGGNTPLWAALEGKKRYAYEALLDCGADPNVVMSGRRVVTHWAATEPDPWWLRLALEHGADPNLVNVGQGQPIENDPLEFAICVEETLENVKHLVEHGADIDRPDRFNSHPLASAFLKGRYEVVLYLLEQGADYELAQRQGIRFLKNVKLTYEKLDLWPLEDRGRIVAIYEWLKSRGVDFDEV